MVNSSRDLRRPDLGLATKVVYGYVTLTGATLVALMVMSALAPRLATDEAWGHQLIVAVFAVVLPLRLRTARRGSARAVRAVAIIGLVIAVVNLVEAALPVFPAWMRIVMLLTTVLMVLLAGVVSGRIGAATVR